MSYNDNEVNEAIMAGERALSSLREAEGYLKSAGGWGVVDMFAGGLITGLFKHSKIKNAKAAMEAAKRDLNTFNRELKDVGDRLPDVDIGNFLTVADFIFDSVIMDAVVQSKIVQARSQVSETIGKVEQILVQLRNL